MSSKHRCKVCGKAFKTSKALAQHLKSKHPGRYYAPRVGIPVAVVAVVVLAALLTPSIFQLPQASPTAPATSTTSATTQATASPTKTATEKPPKAPDFTLPIIDETGVTNEVVSLSDFKGRPVFLEFMSPKCPHCIHMTPVIVELYEKYGDRVEFLTIMLSYGEEWEKLGAEFLAEHEGTDWTHLLDEGLKVFREYDVKGTPTYILLNSEHEIVKVFIGKKPKEELEAALKQVA